MDEGQRPGRPLHRTPRHRGLPLVASTADLERAGGFRPQDRLFVADRAVAALVRHAVVRTGLVATVEDVRLRIEPGPGGDRCVGVLLTVVATSALPLPSLAESLRPVLLATLDETLGPAERTADVHVVDLAPPGDPGPTR